MIKTKIICTMGPATDSDEIIEGLIKSGMNVARLNFSHSNYDEHRSRIKRVREVADKLGRHVAVMLDTRGPEIRLGTFENSPVIIEEGAKFTLTTDKVAGKENIVSVTYKNLYNEVSVGTTILIDDGNVELKVEEIKGHKIICRVIVGGKLSNHKSINIPGSAINMEYMSDKDKEDILFGISEDVDFIAASFVRSVRDVYDLRSFLNANGGSNIRIISKIENRQGVNNHVDIIDASDGIMVARGDMGVEIPFEELPAIQKTIIKRCYQAGKVVITATQMLESMIKASRPTRAEVTDIANAVYDGTSAIMLSGETAVGAHPIEACRTMAKIAEETEKSLDYIQMFNEARIGMENNITNAIGHATCMTAIDLNATAILTVSNSGTTARMISKFRPSEPIICTSPDAKVCRQLALSWGVVPLLSEEKTNIDDLFDHAVDVAKKAGLISNGDIVVITGGAPVGVSGTTNIMKVHIVGDVLVQGLGVNDKNAIGEVYIAKDNTATLKEFTEGQILVAKKTTNALLPVMKKAAGIVVEQEGLDCHAATVGMALELPIIIGATNATKILKRGAVVTLDCEKGYIYSGATRIK